MYQRFYFIAMHWFSRKDNKTKVKKIQTWIIQEVQFNGFTRRVGVGGKRTKSSEIAIGDGHTGCHRWESFIVSNTNTQIQICKYKYANTNMQIQIRKYELQVKCIHDIKLYSAKSLTEL